MSIQTEPRAKINCLTHLLELLGQGHRFTILYNDNHCIGVNESKIFELGETFKKDLLAGHSLDGGNKYIPIEECLSCEVIQKVFKLNKRHSEFLECYFETIKKPA